MAATERFGDRQVAEGDDAAHTLELIKQSIDYMASDQVMSLPKTIREGCRNKHDLCTFWATVGA